MSTKHFLLVKIRHAGKQKRGNEASVETNWQLVNLQSTARRLQAAALVL
ncbi:hypothetical protein [Bacillus sp. M6-12]|nr:hypothetical protein [Bacillus sp. M6-12]